MSRSGILEHLWTVSLNQCFPASSLVRIQVVFGGLFCVLKPIMQAFRICEQTLFAFRAGPCRQESEVSLSLHNFSRYVPGNISATHVVPLFCPCPHLSLSAAELITANCRDKGLDD